MKIAITRPVSPALAECELTYMPRRIIDIRLAAAQHQAYEKALVAGGCELRRLEMQATLPDSVFVEDTAVVLDEVAIITRPGAESRRAETESVTEALRGYRELLGITPPGTLDGGDVLTVGRTLYVGASARSNSASIKQLGEMLGRFNYQVVAIPLRGCLHLKTAVTRVAPDLLLVNPAFVDAALFSGIAWLAVDPAEPHAGNALLVGETVIYPASCPRTRARLIERGIKIIGVDMSETEKAEGGVTCCSLVFEA